MGNVWIRSCYGAGVGALQYHLGARTHKVFVFLNSNTKTYF